MHVCVCVCELHVPIFDDSDEGSNCIIAHLDNTLHLHPQRLLVAKVTWACVNMSSLKADTFLNGITMTL